MSTRLRPAWPLLLSIGFLLACVPPLPSRAVQAAGTGPFPAAHGGIHAPGAARQNGHDGGGGNRLSSHRVFTAVSADGLSWSLAREPVLLEASVPAAIEMPSGRVLLYFVDARRLPSSVNIAESLDGGKTFRRLDTALATPEGFVPVDPCPVLLPDGRVRLYYYLLEHRRGQHDPVHVIASAVSADGIHFQSEGPVFRRAGLVDPDIFWDGQRWRMFVMSLTERATVMATSEGGDSFSYAGQLPLQRIGTTKPVALPPDEGGGFRLYGFPQGEGGQTEFWSFRSADGVAWTREPGVRLALPEGMRQMTDPFVLRLANGTWRMWFKAEP